MKCTVINDDAVAGLRTLPDQSINCVVTSPPYWALRDYGVEGQMGQEPTPTAYVSAMVDVFSEVRRVLRDDGTVWINVGDSYASGPRRRTEEQATAKSGLNVGHGSQIASLVQQTKLVDGLKEKDLVGIPWMLAFALRSDGWFLRGDHIWAKPNAMPSSVADRPSRAHEYVFLFSKSSTYWYDAEPVRSAPRSAKATTLATDKIATDKIATDKQRGHSRVHAGFNARWDSMPKEKQMEEGHNLRSVWWIATAASDEDHFAVMPDRVAEICIRAGCPIGGHVLDPFGGTGTTGVVAARIGMDSTLIELNPKHAKTIERRVRIDAPMLNTVQVTS
jgi:DNA modification methylase